MVISAGAVVSGGAVLRPGWITSVDGIIVGVGEGEPREQPDHAFPDGIAVPGFVDIHVHGGGGASYTDGDPDEVRRAADFHRAHGTTTTVTSTVSATAEDLLSAVERLRVQVHAGVSAGIHLEGPWISHARCGAHDPVTLRAPELDEIDRVLGPPTAPLSW